MTHAILKRISALGLGIGIAAMAAQPGWAKENHGEDTKAGAFIGASAGAPPPGIYMFNQAFTYQAVNRGPNTGIGAVKLNDNVDVQGFVLVPGWTFLGATYDAVVVIPWEAVSVTAPGGGFGSAIGRGMDDPYIVPVELSWKFGDSGFAVKTGLGIYVPMGNLSGVHGCCLADNVGRAWWTFQPELILSYLKDGWNISAFLYYEFSTENMKDGFQNGDIFHVDWNILKTIGKWTIGPVGYYVAQVTHDKPGFDNIAAGFGDQGLWSRVAIGGLVGYDFGAVSVSVWGADEIWQHASGGTPNILGQDTASSWKGWTIFMNLSYRLWAPEEPAPMPKHPLVYK